jgi:hypothetical protein
MKPKQLFLPQSIQPTWQWGVRMLLIGEWSRHSESAFLRQRNGFRSQKPRRLPVALGAGRSGAPSQQFFFVSTNLADVKQVVYIAIGLH